MSDEKCIKEDELGQLKAKAEAADMHIQESNKQGGYRDRLLITEQALASSKAAMEKELSEIKRIVRTSHIKIGFIAGLIGGLMGQVTPQTFQWIVKLLVGK